MKPMHQSYCIPLPDTQLVESKSSLHGALNGVQWVVPKIGPNQPDLSDGLYLPNPKLVVEPLVRPVTSLGWLLMK